MICAIVAIEFDNTIKDIMINGFLVMAWTRIKGNDNMIGYATIVSVSTSCNRCNSLA